MNIKKNQSLKLINLKPKLKKKKTKILQIRKVSASDTVGYSRKGVLKRDSIIGAIPIGYADGYPRSLYTGWLSPIINIDEVLDVSMYIYPVESAVVMKK